MMRIILIALSVLSAFVFPWPATLVLGLLASFMLPPVALLLGVLMELLYGIGGIPYAALIGLIGTLIALLVRSVARARIMGA